MNKESETIKRPDAQIYVLGHKPLSYDYWDNTLYTPLQVGAAFNPQFTRLRDDEGDNIGKWNEVFAESTGMYWAAHNSPDTLLYIGTTQYRRRIEFPEDTDFDALFSKYQIICSEPLSMNISVARQYEICHSKTELAYLKESLCELFPEYRESWDAYIENSGVLFYSTAFIMKRQDFVRYVDFFTKLAFSTLNKMGLKTPNEVREYTAAEIAAGRKPNNDGKFGEKNPVRYQMQIMGFMQERIATLFIRHNFERIMVVPFKKFEGLT